MAKLIGATILLIILIDCFSDRTAYCDEFHSVGITRPEIRKCRCTLTEFGKKRCPHPLIPTSVREKQALKSCLCCKVKSKKDRTPMMEAFCNFPCYSPAPL